MTLQVELTKAMIEADIEQDFSSDAINVIFDNDLYHSDFGMCWAEYDNLGDLLNDYDSQFDKDDLIEMIALAGDDDERGINVILTKNIEQLYSLDNGGYLLCSDAN